MNKELKVMIYSALSLLVILLVAINIINLNSSKYINEATISSQRVALNRLKHPNLTRSSEVGKYPQLKKQKKIKLLATKGTHRLYVISDHKVIYIVNAKVNIATPVTTIKAARGEYTFHVNGNNQGISNNWLNFRKLGYIESPYSINNHRVRGNWIKNKYSLPCTIEVSRPDAKWLRQVPKGTAIIVR